MCFETFYETLHARCLMADKTSLNLSETVLNASALFGTLLKHHGALSWRTHSNRSTPNTR